MRWVKKIKGITDSGYTGIKKIQSTVKLPHKRKKEKSLTKGEKKENRMIASSVQDNFSEGDKKNSPQI